MDETLEKQLMDFAVCAAKVWKDYTGYDINCDVVRKAMTLAEEFYIEEVEMVDYAKCDGMDTYVREVILDNISQWIVGMPFPAYGDSDETKKQFGHKLEKYFTGA